MRYKIGKDIIIRSENAAKPASQTSSFLVSYIKSLDHVSSSFDYGCGKLRYKNAILSTTETLTAVDSEIQLSRTQKLEGAQTSVRSLCAGSNRVVAQNTTEFGAKRVQYDRGFCINVLSVIPILEARKRVLFLIRSRLRTNANCLFVVQYRNSDFTRMQKMPNARPWRDGFLIDSLRGYSFYGLISPDALADLVRSASFEVLDMKLNEGSAYLLAKPKGDVSPPPAIEIDENQNFAFKHTG